MSDDVDSKEYAALAKRQRKLAAENARFRHALERIAHGNVMNWECPSIAYNALRGVCPKCEGKGRTPFSRGLHGEVVCSRCDGSGVES